MERKDEFTVEMHAEMLEGELSYLGVKSLEVQSFINNEKLSVEDACKKSGITDDEFHQGQKDADEWAKSAFT